MNQLCEQCRRPFAPRRKGLRFCSKSCSARFTARNRRNGSDNPNWKGGKKTHPLYHVHYQMVARCHRPDHPRYHDYGGRGITVCDDWRNDFWCFVRDVGERPAKGMSLDRIDNDGGYFPENVRWATASQQRLNSRRPARPRSNLEQRA